MIRPVANRKCRVLIISIAAVHRGSQIRDLDVDGGAPAQRIELLRQPLTGRRPAHVAQAQEEAPISGGAIARSASPPGSDFARRLGNADRI